MWNILSDRHPHHGDILWLRDTESYGELIRLCDEDVSKYMFVCSRVTGHVLLYHNHIVLWSVCERLRDWWCWSLELQGMWLGESQLTYRLPHIGSRSREHCWSQHEFLRFFLLAFFRGRILSQRVCRFQRCVHRFTDNIFEIFGVGSLIWQAWYALPADKFGSVTEASILQKQTGFQCEASVSNESENLKYNSDEFEEGISKWWRSCIFEKPQICAGSIMVKPRPSS